MPFVQDDLPATGTPPAQGAAMSEVVARHAANSVLTLPVRALRLPLVSNAFFLMLNTTVSGALGAAFWLVAARLYSESDVGFVAAIVPLAGLLANMGTLGLSAGLIRFLPEAKSDPDRTRRMVNTSLTLSVVSALALGVLFVGGGAVWSANLALLQKDLAIAAGFVAFCGLFAVGPILDAAAVAYRESRYVFVRSTLYNGMRVPLPFLFVGILGVIGLLLSFLLGALVAAVLAGFAFLPRFLARYRPKPTLRLDVLRPLFRFSIGNHVAGIIAILVPSLLPLLVVNLRGLTENAWFFVAWFVGSMLYVIPSSFATSLFAEGSQRNQKIARDVGRVFLGSAVLVLPTGLFLWFRGDWILGIFGASYAVAGFELLRWLLLATPFVVVNNVYFTLVRIEKRVAPIIAAAAAAALLALGGSAVFLPMYGLPGVGIAWLLAEGVVTASLGIVLGRRRLIDHRPPRLAPRGGPVTRHEVGGR